MTKQIKNTILYLTLKVGIHNPIMNILLDKCSFVDPRFKQSHGIDDEPVKQVISEMESIMDTK